MNLLTGYDSSGDEEEHDHRLKKIEKVPTTESENKISSHTGPSSSSSSLAVLPNTELDTAVAGKKRKALIFSTLPIEIQNALTRGSTAQDSDSDDDTADATSKSLGNNKSYNGGGLLSLLPAPKNPTADTKGPSTSTSKTQIVLSNTVESVIRIPKTSENSKQNAAATDKHDSDEEDYSGIFKGGMDSLRGGSMFSLSSAAVSTPLVNPIARAGHLSIQSFGSSFIAPKLGASYDSSVGSRDSSDSVAYFPDSFRGHGVTPSSEQVTAFKSNTYDNVQAVSSSQQDSARDNPEPDYGNGSIARKRRERDIEQQLISGNLDAAQSMGGGGMKEMRASNDWNAHAYTAQKQNEAELHRAFFAAKGGEKAIAPVSKLQGRKHQINSLVMQAAKTELALLNAKGERNVSKQETKGKYGW